MKKRNALLAVFLLLLIYPLWMMFQVQAALEGQVLEVVKKQLLQYQISIWVSWVVVICMAIYIKWTLKRNAFFFLTYAFIILTFAVFGYFWQQMVSTFGLPSSFQDPYTLGVMISLQNIFMAGILTGLVQAAVWWFTRRWHRR